MSFTVLYPEFNPAALYFTLSNRSSYLKVERVKLQFTRGVEEHLGRNFYPEPFKKCLLEITHFMEAICNPDFTDMSR